MANGVFSNNVKKVVAVLLQWRHIMYGASQEKDRIKLVKIAIGAGTFKSLAC